MINRDRSEASIKQMQQNNYIETNFRVQRAKNNLENINSSNDDFIKIKEK